MAVVLHLTAGGVNLFSLGTATLIALLGLGVIANGLPFLLFTSGLRKASLTTGALFLTLIPAVSIAISALTLHEHLSITQLVGAALTIGCVALGARSNV